MKTILTTPQGMHLASFLSSFPMCCVPIRPFYEKYVKLANEPTPSSKNTEKPNFSRLASREACVSSIGLNKNHKSKLTEQTDSSSTLCSSLNSGGTRGLHSFIPTTIPSNTQSHISYQQWEKEEIA